MKDPRFATNAARVENKAALCAMIDAIFLTRSKGEWIDLLEAEGVPCAVINSLPEAAAHPQAAALDMIQPMPGDDFSLVGAAAVLRRRPAEDPLGAAEHRRARQVVRGRGALARALTRGADGGPRPARPPSVSSRRQRMATGATVEPVKPWAFSGCMTKANS